jgi:anti-sigma B factor antagonist
MRSSVPPPALEVSSQPDRTVLRFVGCDTFDEYNSPDLAERLSALPLAALGEHFLLDLDGVRYVSSTGLGALVDFNRRVRAAGGRFALANAAHAVREVLALTRLDKVLEVLPDEDSSSGRLSA